MCYENSYCSELKIDNTARVIWILVTRWFFDKVLNLKESAKRCQCRFGNISLEIAYSLSVNVRNFYKEFPVVPEFDLDDVLIETY